MPMKRAIEEDFPIVEINRLAVPERNSFKPICQMHKWFARRASCVFRAILLGAFKPAGTNIMEEFYKDHSHDADTNGKVILDPFMRGRDYRCGGAAARLPGHRHRPESSSVVHREDGSRTGGPPGPGCGV